MKHSDYLTENKLLQLACQSYEDEPNYDKAIFELPHQSTSTSKYNTQREKDTVENIVQELESKDFYQQVSVDYYFTERRSYRCIFYKHSKSFGVPMKEIILFAQHYAGSNGNRYFVWKEDLSLNDHLIERQKTINEITNMLPKYFSREHKQKLSG